MGGWREGGALSHMQGKVWDALRLTDLSFFGHASQGSPSCSKLSPHPPVLCPSQDVLQHFYPKALMSELSLYMHRALVDLHAAFPNRQAKRTCKRVRHMCTPGSTYLALHKTATYTCDGISPPFSLPYIFFPAPSPPPPIAPPSASTTC